MVKKVFLASAATLFLAGVTLTVAPSEGVAGKEPLLQDGQGGSRRSKVEGAPRLEKACRKAWKAAHKKRGSRLDPARFMQHGDPLRRVLSFCRLRCRHTTRSRRSSQKPPRPPLMPAKLSDRFDPHHVFRHLVAELPLDAEPQRRAVRDGKRLVVHLVGENGLRRGRRRRARSTRNICRPRCRCFRAHRRNRRRCSARSGFSRARSSSAPSGTPFHLPMQLQPSTQSCRVIWVRDGMARSSASDSSSGVSTRPPTDSFQSAKPFVGMRHDRPDRRDWSSRSP